MKHPALFALVTMSFLLMISCASVISQQYVEIAVKNVSFSQVLEAPDKYRNATFIFGGTIVETENTKEGAEIEVIQNPIDKYGEIIDKDVSEGRFIIMSPGHLDPLIYRRNWSITMAGKLMGARDVMSGERKKTYLLFGVE